MKFKNDYIVSWEFNGDVPTVTIKRAKMNDEVTSLEMNKLGVFHTKTGYASLQKLVEKFEAEQEATKGQK